jgi:DNA invertase Pin-like site-specific DNA recombinase
MQKFVVYTRVSTADQGRSGLGLEAQERDVQVFFDSYAETPFEVIERFCDVESGSKADRPELGKAIAQTKKERAVLLVAKLDRLSRKVSHIAAMMDDDKLEFRVASMPRADKFQLHIYAALAEQERDFVSTRTKAALQAAKARGVKLGGQRDEAGRRHEAVKAAADGNAQRVSSVILRGRTAGLTYRQIADELNLMGVATARGRNWFAAQVHRYAQRLDR